MKYSIFIALSMIPASTFAQEASLKFNRNTEFNSSYNNLNNKKETLIEKQIFSLGKVKDLNFQKIILKDTKEDKSISVLGVMTFFETFDSISKRTITFDKDEVNLLINNLQTIEQKTVNKPNIETKYKYSTNNYLEIGSSFNEELNSWTYYLKLPNSSSQNSILLNKNEFKELLNILKKIENDL
jgi:hypothetical protein